VESRQVIAEERKISSLFGVLVSERKKEIWKKWHYQLGWTYKGK
jgi:hypothetical protein